MQSSTTKKNTRPLFRTLRVVLQSNGGIFSLYRGLLPAFLGSVLSGACYFHCFQRAKNFIAPYFSTSTTTTIPTSAHLLSGTMAGLFTSFVTNPIWVVKVRLQLQQSTSTTITSQQSKKIIKPYSGFFDALYTIVKEEGIYGLYKGLAPSLWLVSHGALQFTLYESIKSYLYHRRQQQQQQLSKATFPILFSTDHHPHPHHQSQQTGGTSVSDALIASTVSKLIASVTTYPLQVARTRMQERMADGRRYGSFHRALWYITKTEGIKGLYRGLSANIVRVTPHAAVTFVTYEQILKLCAKNT